MSAGHSCESDCVVRPRLWTYMTMLWSLAATLPDMCFGEGRMFGADDLPDRNVDPHGYSIHGQVVERS